MGELLFEPKKHSFEIEKEKLRQFSEEAINDTQLNKVKYSKTTGEFWGDVFLGRGFGTDHKVTGNELNDLTSQMQKHLQSINETEQKCIKEFGQVYTALEALDKDYIQSIVVSVKSAQEANKEAKKAQEDIKRTIDEQKKIIKVLCQHKEKLEQYKHIADVDRLWDKFDIFQKDANAKQWIIDALAQFKGRIEKCEHIYDVDKMWLDNQSQRNDIDDLIEGVIQITSSIENIENTIDEKQRKIDNIENFKKKIESYEHLLDIDSIWNDVAEGNKNIATLSEQTKSLISETSQQMTELTSCRQLIDKLTVQKHIYEVDSVWQSLEETKEKLEAEYGKAEKCLNLLEKHTQLTDKLNYRVEQIDEFTEVMIKYNIELKNKVEELSADKGELKKNIDVLNSKLNDEHSKFEELELKFSNKLKTAYLLAGGAVGLAVLELVVVLLRLV